MISHKLSRLALATTLLALAAPAAFAQAQIDQNKVLAGNVTPGDTAGFPLTLSQPGSYKLTSNLYVPSGVVGIEITAQGVTLDLNGFSVRSSNTCTQISSTLVVTCSEATISNFGGISINADVPTGVTVRNGTVQGFRGFGVYANAGSILSDLVVRENGRYGISNQHGSGLNLDRIEATLNLSGGVFINQGSVANQVRATSNGGAGFFGDAGLVVNSTAVRNQGVGFSGVTVSQTVAAANKAGDTANVTSLGSNKAGTTVY